MRWIAMRWRRPSRQCSAVVLCGARLTVIMVRTVARPCPRCTRPLANRRLPQAFRFHQLFLDWCPHLASLMLGMLELASLQSIRTHRPPRPHHPTFPCVSNLTSSRLPASRRRVLGIFPFHWRKSFETPVGISRQSREVDVAVPACVFVAYISPRTRSCARNRPSAISRRRIDFL